MVVSRGSSQINNYGLSLSVHKATGPGCAESIYFK